MSFLNDIQEDIHEKYRKNTFINILTAWTSA